MIRLVYPLITFTNRNLEHFDDVRMLDISFPTTIHYFKNYDTGYEGFMFCILGFGLDFSRFTGAHQ